MTLADRYTFGEREHLALRMMPCVAPQTHDMRLAAKAYLAAGYEIVPLLPGTKETHDTGWQDRVYTLADVRADSNLGLKCIPTVIDIDCLLALKCADDFLPTTPRIDGRPGKPRSHRAYLTELKSEDFKDIDGRMLVQILAGRGKQAVVPPSLWVDTKNPQHQERRVWTDGSLTGPLASRPEAPFLHERVRYIATVALIAGHWPQHGRHDLRLAYARVLLDMLKLDDSVATRILTWGCRLGGSDEHGVRDAASAVQSTKAALNHDKQATGGATVTKLLSEGDKLIARLREWYGVSRAGLVITRAADVPDEKLELAFGGRLLRGSFPLLVGPGDVGKGMFAVFILACFTTGAPFPGERVGCPPRNVLICATEDSKGRIKSRLRAAGADLTRVFFVDGPEVVRGGLVMASSMMLDDDAGELLRKAKQLDAGAFFLETLVEHFGDRAGKTRPSTHTDAEVRNALAPFRSICQRAGLYGLGAIHPRKSVEGGVEDSISGAAAFRNVPRGTLHIYRDPADTTNDPVRLLFSDKANYLNQRPPTLRFRIRSWDEYLASPCQCHAPNCGHEGRVVWEDDLVDTRTAEDIWKQIATRGKPRRDVAVQEAEKFLRGLMQDGKIALTVDEIFKQAKEEGISTSSVYSAKRNLGLVSVKSKEFQAEVTGWQEKEGEL